MVNLWSMVSFNSRLKSLVKERQSWLCVGLDMNPEAFGPGELHNLKEHTFNVIDATREFAVAYKPNFAFFERWGAAGFAWLEETVSYIGDDFIKIADAKRGDIGNTAAQYAKGIFGHFGFDGVTLSPYMGRDSIDPFLMDQEKGVFILCRTSNPSAKDVQDGSASVQPLYETVAQLGNDLNTRDNVGLVVGATAPEELSRIREIAPELPFLIPGVGAQGGDLEHSIRVGNQSGVGLINVSRGISFVGDLSESTIHTAAREYVEDMREAMG
ncbi:MAG: orotidine-5'-phosphate decarboxylase [Candidatus Neomarinimicrobiota bacterium]|nr:orotidine-5'-phosphate decarboxylase [Candidatus Neomarinimicrobiota bacterium]